MPRIKDRPDPADDEGAVQPVVVERKSRLARLKGPVRTNRPNSSSPWGVDWGNVARYAREYESNAAREGVDPLVMAGMGLVESDSTHFRPDGSVVVRPSDGFDSYPAVGLMQVKPHYHQWRDPEADPYTVDGNIRLAVLIIADGIRQYGSWEKALVRLYFPGDDVNGTTQGSYIGAIKSLVAEIRNQTRPTPGPDPDPDKPPPKPGPDRDPLEVIFGGRQVRVDYGFRADVGLNYYKYGVGHGTTAPTQHTGDDVPVPDETPLYAPAPGVVTCVGWQGNPTWGQGCGYFEDQMGGGVGNISILLDAARKVVLGHSSRASVRVGQRVKAGEPVGTSGGMNGPHTHLEVAIQKGGTYWLVDPQPELRAVMKGGDVIPPPHAYAERLPIPQPAEFDRFARVVATRGGVKVLQRAFPGAEEVRAPLEQGEDFEACYQVMGLEGDVYWITSLGSRVPVVGTESDDWPVE